MKKNKLSQKEKGASFVIIAASLVVLFFAAAVVVDYGAVTMEKNKLQNALDAAALASARDLPNPDVAVQVARDYLQKNGYNPDGFVIKFIDGNHRISIQSSTAVDYTFAKVFGISSGTVYGVASATRNFGPFDYALFSQDYLWLNDNDTDIYGIAGSVYAQDGLKITGNGTNITGIAESAGSVQVDETKVTVGGVLSNSDDIAMPDFSQELYDLAVAAGTFHEGDLELSGNTVVTSPIYVYGNVTIKQNATFSGQGAILATGNITFQGSNQYSDSESVICFYSKNGNIVFNGQGAQLKGIMYAPNGSVTFNGQGPTLEGRIIAKTMKFNGKGLTINGAPYDLSTLPSVMLRKMRLVE